MSALLVKTTLFMGWVVTDSLFCVLFCIYLVALPLLVSLVCWCWLSLSGFVALWSWALIWSDHEFCDLLLLLLLLCCDSVFVLLWCFSHARAGQFLLVLASHFAIFTVFTMPLNVRGSLYVLTTMHPSSSLRSAVTKTWTFSTRF